jgi:FkbM family methyltransferase
VTAVDSLRNWYRARATSIRRKSRILKSRLNWRWARLWPEFTCRIERGAALTVPSNSQIARGLYEGFYEFRERAFLVSFLRPTDVFYDIGANVGLYSVIAATIIGPRGSVYSFEPNELSLRFLKRNMERISGCSSEVFGLALSDSNGELELSVPSEGYDAWATLGSISTLNTPVVKQRVATVTLDDLRARAGFVPPTVVKIDVEGWEVRVLRGAEGVLRGPNPPLLMVELCDRASEGAGSSTAELLAAIEDLGMELYELAEDSTGVVPLSRRDSYPYLNVFAATPGSSAGLRIREVLAC